MAMNTLVGPSLKKSTERAYRADLDAFHAHCAESASKELPAETNTIIGFINRRLNDGYKPASILRSLHAVGKEHKLHGLSSPLPHARVAIKCLYELKNPIKKHPVTAANVISMAERANADGSLKGKHDRALMLIGFGPLKRSKLVTLTVADLKTLPLGPMTRVAVQEWLAASGITRGRIFRRFRRGDHLQSDPLSASNVSTILKRWAKEIGLDHTSLAGESLRSGYRKHCAMVGLL